MKGIRLRSLLHSSFKLILGLAFALNLAVGVCAQEVVQASDNVAEAAARQAAPAPETEAQRRIARARALAASGKRGVAAGELESLFASTKDESVRDVSRILLMWIYIEMPDYARAAQLLDLTYNARAASGEDGTRDYFTLAGQVLGGARAHVERYRTFGLRPDDAELPPEAKSDLDQMRSLLERVLEQSKQIRGEASRASERGGHAAALVEEAANVRVRLARDDEERARWQNEIADARQRLFAPDTRIAKVSDSRAAAPNVQTQSATPQTQGATPATAAAAPPVTSAGAQTAASTSSGQNANNSAANDASTAPGERQAGKSGEAAPKSESGTVAVGALHGIATQKISPSYPQIARTARVSGLVTVYVVVNEKGEVERVQRADGPLQLQSAASEAARRWKFRPTLVDGQPVRVSGYINFNFSL